jgi:hypothetical protein
MQTVKYYVDENGVIQNTGSLMPENMYLHVEGNCVDVCLYHGWSENDGAEIVGSFVLYDTIQELVEAITLDKRSGE